MPIDVEPFSTKQKKKTTTIKTGKHWDTKYVFICIILFTFVIAAAVKVYARASYWLVHRELVNSMQCNVN